MACCVLLAGWLAVCWSAEMAVWELEEVALVSGAARAEMQHSISCGLGLGFDISFRCCADYSPDGDGAPLVGV